MRRGLAPAEQRPARPVGSLTRGRPPGARVRAAGASLILPAQEAPPSPPPAPVQVTVWAVEQEDPARTLAKWQRIAPPESTSGRIAEPVQEGRGAGDGPGGEPGDGQQKEARGMDCLVPWHLPMHRAEAHRAAAMAGGGPAEAGRGGPTPALAGGSAPGAGADTSPGITVRPPSRGLPHRRVQLVG